jgi:hypothetical protein
MLFGVANPYTLGLGLGLAMVVALCVFAVA